MSSRAKPVETEVERRRETRAAVCVSIQYASVDALFSEFTRNINEGGVFVATENPLGLDQLVTLQFRLPGSHDFVQARGRVIRVESPSDGQPGGMAIEFEDLDRDAHHQIDKLVRGLRAAGG